MKNAVLLLKDGTYFTGENFGIEGEVFGEVVFNTSMTGYQEITTDASYNGQMVCMTYPLIGNYGMNQEDSESYKTHVEGFIVKELCQYHSNFRATISPNDFFVSNNIVGIKGIDTRALTQHIRQFGSMEGVISTKCGNVETLLKKLNNHSQNKRQLVHEVTIKEPYIFEGSGKKICLLDFGVKSNIIKSLNKRNCEIIVLPAFSDANTVMSYEPDGVVLSNGPGDPRDLPEVIKVVKTLIDKNVPLFGICLGHQLLSLAMGLTIYKLKFGHHGGNHAVKDLLTTKCYITCQNHNYAVSHEDIPDGVTITHYNVNDKTIEGFIHKEKNILSIQYHPESSPGPTDSAYLFDDFIKMLER